MVLFSLAFAAPIDLFVDSPVPVTVRVDERSIGDAWLEQTVEVTLSEGQTLTLVCGKTRLEPTPYTRGPMKVVVRKAEGPCQLGSSDTTKLAKIIFGSATDDSPLTELYSDPEGVGNLDAALGNVAPVPTGPMIARLDCIEGCVHPGTAKLRTQLLRYERHIQHCARQHDASMPQKGQLVLERTGTRIADAHSEGLPPEAASCLDARMKRWRVPADTPETSTWQIELAPSE